MLISIANQFLVGTIPSLKKQNHTIKYSFLVFLFTQSWGHGILGSGFQGHGTITTDNIYVTGALEERTRTVL